MNFLNNYLPPLLINTSILELPQYFPLSINMDIKKQINMCVFISMKCILIEIKFDIDIHNDELFKTI
jgi:hypothetical protein